MKEAIKGLTSKEVEKSFERYGDNSLVKEKGKSFFRRYIENLSDPIIRILIIALVLQVVFTMGNCNYFEIFGIVIAILLSTTVSTVSEYRSEKAFDKLNEDSLNTYVSVLRDGEIKKILNSKIVVGDIVYLSSGDKIPADGEIISGRMFVDQSALNGESAECKKEPSNESGWDLSIQNKVFRGSNITEGNGIVKVLRVGGATYYGMVAKDVQTETRESPLKLRLGRLAALISKIGYVTAGLVGFCYLFNSIVVDNGFSPERISEYVRNIPVILESLIHTLTLMITVVVVAAPEGLPMMITVVLSANMKKMLSDSILVKKLVGIETAGSMNILFTDKTGTLTYGKMRCDRIVAIDGVYKGIAALDKTGMLYKNLLLSARYNTDVLEESKQKSGGNATDNAIYSFFERSEAVFASVRTKSSFSSEKKYSSVTLDSGITYIKGAPEVVLPKCELCLNSKGETLRCDMNVIERELKFATERGERVVAIAMREGASELVFLGLAVLKDKIRKGVKEAVREVSKAGIQTVMVTGDSKETAVSIAEECGLMNKSAGHIALSSVELSSMSDDEVKLLLPRLRVVARALPQDKTRLVRLSQELDLVAGMTGDGINDAPSLKLSDVGFGMGSGTDIAKSAADIVILDDSFSAISKTVLYGRTIFKSIRKFITFQLIMNLTACGVSLVGQFVGIDTPITIIQMLWINIIMDTLGGLAFAGEAPMKYYMYEKPKRRDEPILSGEMLKRIFFQGAFSLGICIFFLTSHIFRTIYNYYSSPAAFYTAFYALFVFLGIFNCFGARSERLWLFSNISKNRLFIFIMLAISMIQLLMIYYGGAVFRCVPLSPKELWFAVSTAFAVIPFDIARRIVAKLK